MRVDILISVVSMVSVSGVRVTVTVVVVSDLSIVLLLVLSAFDSLRRLLDNFFHYLDWLWLSEKLLSVGKVCHFNFDAVVRRGFGVVLAEVSV